MHKYCSIWKSARTWNPAAINGTTKIRLESGIIIEKSEPIVVFRLPDDELEPLITELETLMKGKYEDKDYIYDQKAAGETKPTRPSLPTGKGFS